MQSTILLYVIIREGPAIFKLLASEDEALLSRRYPLFVLYLILHSLNGIGEINGNREGLTREPPNEDLYNICE